MAILLIPEISLEISHDLLTRQWCSDKDVTLNMVSRIHVLSSSYYVIRLKYYFNYVAMIGLHNFAYSFTFCYFTTNKRVPGKNCILVYQTHVNFFLDPKLVYICQSPLQLGVAIWTNSYVWDMSGSDKNHAGL